MKYVMKCSGCGSDKDFVRFGTMDDLLECKCGEQTYCEYGELVEDVKRQRVEMLDKQKLLNSLKKDVNEFCRLASDADDSFSNDCLMFASALHELRRAIRKGDFDVKGGDSE